MLALRFANQLFEPIWNANYVDHVQITMAEDIGIARPRRVLRRHRRGARRHPEPPAAAARADRDGGAGLLRRGGPARGEGEGALRRPAAQGPRPAHRARAVRRRLAGRRGGGRLPRGGRASPAGLDAPRRTPRSGSTSTPAAGPACRSTCAPASGWAAGSPRSPSCSSAPRTCPFESTATEELGKNALVIRVQPDEGVTMRFGSKVPGTAMEVRDVTMDFGYGHAFTESSPEAYERLILDVLLGDPPLFPRHGRSSSPGRSSTRSPSSGRAHGAPSRTGPGTWGPAVGGRDDGPRRARLAHGREGGTDDHRPAGHDHRRDVAKALVRLRDEGGAVALGRVLTLVIDAGRRRRRGARSRRPTTPAASTRAGSSCWPETGARRGARSTRRSGSAVTPGPARSIVLRASGELLEHADTLVMPLLLPDAPIVAWWPYEMPARAVGAPDRARWPSGGSPTSLACADPLDSLRALRDGLHRGRHRPGVDPADGAGGRSSPPALDQPPYERVSPGRWSAATTRTPRCRCSRPGSRRRCAARWSSSSRPTSRASREVRLERESGPIVLDRPDGRIATLHQPGQPDRHIAMPLRSFTECLRRSCDGWMPTRCTARCSATGWPGRCGMSAGRGRSIPTPDARPGHGRPAPAGTWSTRSPCAGPCTSR